MYIKNHSNSVRASNQVQLIDSNRNIQYVMVDNSVNTDNHVQHIDDNSVAQPEDFLLPLNQPKLIRGIGYYLKREDN